MPTSRLDHFPDAGPEDAPAPVSAPGLEYDKYHITPGLLRTLEDMVLQVSPPSSIDGMDAILRRHASACHRNGQFDMIRMLGLLMASQETQI